MCLCMCLSVTSRCSIELFGWTELVFGMEASFDRSYTVFQGNYVSPKIGLSVIPSGTFS